MSQLLTALISQFEQSTNMAGGGATLRGRVSTTESFGSLVKEHAHKLSRLPEYAKHLADVPEGKMKENMAIQMDNWTRATKYMMESTKAAAIGDYNTLALGMIRATIPEMQSDRLFTMQNMYGPSATVFYFDAVYGTTNGVVRAGQKLFENLDPNYGDNTIDTEVVVSNPDGTAVTFEFHLDHSPVQPGTLELTDGTSIITDDAQGNLVGDVAAAGGDVTLNKINYKTGACKIKFATAPQAANAIAASYSVATEADADAIPEIDLSLTSAPVVARSKKLRVRFSLEANYALRDVHGIDAEAEAVAAMGAEIAYGVDSNNVDTVKRVAVDLRNDPNYQFNREPRQGIPSNQSYAEFVDVLIAMSSLILRTTGKAIGNKLIVGERVANMIEALAPRFQATQYRASRGIHYMGVLDGRWEIFKDMRMDPDEYMMLFRGDDMLYAGFIFAPWILSFTTPTTILDDFAVRKGMGSLYGQKIINNKMFVRGKIVKEPRTT